MSDNNGNSAQTQKRGKAPWLSRLWPRTIARQILLVLTLVLIASQAINLFLILGQRILVLRSNTLNTAISETVRQISLAPSLDFTEGQPIYIPASEGVPGSYFFSNFNAALLGPPEVPAEHLSKVQAQLTEALVSEGLFAIDIIAVRRINTQGPPPSRQRSPLAASGQNPGAPAMAQQGLPRNPPGMAPPMGPGFEPGPFSTTPTEEINLSVNLAQDVWFNAQIRHTRSELFSLNVLLSTLVLLLGALGVTGYVVNKISQPFAQFAHAAELLGRGDVQVEIEETGPQDIRVAAEAFNKMQNRLTRMIETQRTMLRAVSHDLRTPLTAMRINVEQIKDDGKRDHLIKSIDEMTVITEELLGWAKDVSGSEAMAAVNLTSLLQSVCEDYQDAGQPVSFHPTEAAIVKIRRVAMKRVFQNLINNALKYGGSADIHVESFPKFIRIYVDDTGPGIPQDQLGNVLKPFVRLEDSRNKDTGGTGLGLSISQAIIQGDGGKLSLANRKEGGLRVTVEISKSSRAES